jgi:hypothetical protein
MMTREQRLKDREVRRILHAEQLEKEQEQLAKLEEEAANGLPSTSRISERQLKADVERRKKELEELQQQEEWIFDCSVCGVHGKNLDDGSHSIACEKCNVWQHSGCHGIDKEKAERDDFHFTCGYCEEKMRNPVPTLKLKFGAKDEQQAKPKKPKEPKQPKDPKTTTPRPKKTKPTTGNQPSPHQSVTPRANGSGAFAQAPYSSSPVPRHTSDINRLVYPGPPPPVPHNSLQQQQSPPRPAVHSSPPQQYQFQHSFAHPNGLAQQPRPYPQQTQYPYAYQSQYQQYRPPQPYTQPQLNGVAQSPPRQSVAPAPAPAHPPYSPPVQGHGAMATNGYSHQNYPQPRSSSSHQYQFQAYSTPRQPQREPTANTSPNGYRPPQAVTPTGTSAATTSSQHHLPAMRMSGPSAVHSSNPPTPHLPSPHQNRASPEVARGPLTSSQAALQGSSPGYSPTKPPSPPRPALRADMDRNITSPPVTLQPQPRAQILSPPIKKLNPIHSSPIGPMSQSASSNGQVPHNGGFPKPTPLTQTTLQPSNILQPAQIAQQSPPLKSLPALPSINQLVQSTRLHNGPFTQITSVQPPLAQPLQPQQQQQQQQAQQQQQQQQTAGQGQGAPVDRK